MIQGLFHVLLTRRTKLLFIFSAVLEHCSSPEVCSWRSVVSRPLAGTLQTFEDAQRHHPGEADIWRCDGEC